MAILPKKFGIAPTTKDKLGGMEIAAGLEVSFLESQNAVPQIDGAARVDWNGKFSWDVALTNLQLLKSADLGFLSIENVMLDRLQATDEFMELGMSATKLKVGNFLDTGAIRFSWNSKSGLYLAIDDLALALPDPIGAVKGTMQMRIDEAGKLALFQVDKFSAGKDADFTIERAAYSTGRFAIEEAQVQAAEGRARHRRVGERERRDQPRRRAEKLGGAFTVDKLRPFDDDKVIVGGSALLGYSKADGFYFGLDNANLTVDTASFHGQAGLSAVFKTKTKALTGKVSILEIGTPFVTLTLENAKFSNKKVDDYEAGIFVDRASIRFGGANKEDTQKNITDVNPDGWSMGLRALSFAGQFMKATVEKPRYTKADGLKWDDIKGGLALPDEASISLFGGRLTGMYNKKTRTAALGARFTYDPLPLPTLVAEYHFVPALGVFIEFGLFGGVAVGVEAKVEQPKKDSDIDLSGKLALTGHIGVKLAGGFMVGSNYIAAAQGRAPGHRAAQRRRHRQFPRPAGQDARSADVQVQDQQQGRRAVRLRPERHAHRADRARRRGVAVHDPQQAARALEPQDLGSGKFHVAGNSRRTRAARSSTRSTSRTPRPPRIRRSAARSSRRRSSIPRSSRRCRSTRRSRRWSRRARSSTTRASPTASSPTSRTRPT